jgi:hypothetical protein
MSRERRAKRSRKMHAELVDGDVAVGGDAPVGEEGGWRRAAWRWRSARR